jgi:hypothetical protein
MRYQIVRRNAITVLFFFCVGMAFALSLPWIYKNIFINEEDFIIKENLFRTNDVSDALKKIGINGNVSWDADFLKGGYVLSRLKINDLAVNGITVSADIFMKGRNFMDKESGDETFSGKLFSRNTRLNSNLFADISMSFKIIDDEFKIESLRMGKSYELKGGINLAAPPKADLRLNINRADMRDLGMFAKIKNPGLIHGIMNGVFYIKGPLTNLSSKGIIESKRGRVGPVAYNFARIGFEGSGPVINIMDSRVVQEKGMLTMEGYLDIRNLARADMFEGLKVKSDLNTIIWDGWDISKEGPDKLSMTKDISDTIRVGFKAMAREPFTTFYNKDNQEEMSLEYKLGEDNLKVKLKDNEEFFGIERNVRF